ncbi:MAG: VanZ family protein [Lysobacterales bacterium]
MILAIARLINEYIWLGHVKRYNNFIKFWFPVLVYSGIIFLVSAQSNLKPPIDVVYNDKACHLVEYGIWGLLVMRALFNSVSNRNMWMMWICVVLAAFVYGLSDEYHQLFVVGRHFDFIDVLFDTLGGFLGAGSYVVFKLKQNR